MDVTSESNEQAAALPLPDGFDWHIYLKWNQDVKKAGMNTKELAEAHYLNNGKGDQRIYKKPRLTLRYG